MLVITTKRRQRQREDEAFAEGANADQDEVEDFIAGKDDFIAKQSGIITDLMKVVGEAKAWNLVPDELRFDLADYV